MHAGLSWLWPGPSLDGRPDGAGRGAEEPVGVAHPVGNVMSPMPGEMGTSTVSRMSR